MLTLPDTDRRQTLRALRANVGDRRYARDSIFLGVYREPCETVRNCAVVNLTPAQVMTLLDYLLARLLEPPTSEE